MAYCQTDTYLSESRNTTENIKLSDLLSMRQMCTKTYSMHVLETDPASSYTIDQISGEYEAIRLHLDEVNYNIHSTHDYIYVCSLIFPVHFSGDAYLIRDDRNFSPTTISRVQQENCALSLLSATHIL